MVISKDIFSKKFISTNIANEASINSTNMWPISTNFATTHHSINYDMPLFYIEFLDVVGLLSNKKGLSMKIYNNWVIDNMQLFYVRDFFTSKLYSTEVGLLTLICAKELMISFDLFFYKWLDSSYFSYNLSNTFDSYISLLNLNNFLFTASILMYSVFIILVTIFFFYKLVNSINDSTDFYVTRVIQYTYSISKEIRIQFEVVLQTIVFFIFFWAPTLMTFDDHKEEVIEFIDSNFFYFFMLIIFYLTFKYSVHYFSFLESLVVEGRSVNFITKQVFKDFLNSLSLLLRFYILLLRVNVYDTLDDFLDSYYICVGDFDEDEYLAELTLSISRSLLFLTENDYDTSFLFEDEYGFKVDWFYLYYVSWGKLFYFMFFILEEAARLGLAFYVCYLITFEVHSINCTYSEDLFLTNKRQTN